MSRRVNFSRDSPPSGPGSRYSSDSGVGSSGFQSAEDERQWNSLPELQQAYRALFADKEHYKRKAAIATEEAKKAVDSAEARVKALKASNEELQITNDEFKALNKSLKDRIQDLKVTVEELEAEVKKYEKREEKREQKRSSKSSSPTTMSGGNPDSKPRRTTSKRESKDKKEKARRSESRERESETSKSTRNSKRSSQSYNEGWGPRDEPSTAKYPSYSQSSMSPPITAPPISRASFSSVPRTVVDAPMVRPTVYYEQPTPLYADPRAAQYPPREDGEYHFHDLGPRGGR
jgi:hypothetical protein